MIEPFVLLFLQMLLFQPTGYSTPIYFWNKAACEKVAAEYNTDPVAKRTSRAVCRSMGTIQPSPPLLQAQ